MNGQYPATTNPTLLTSSHPPLQLRELGISHCPKICSLGPLRSCSRLEVLRMAACALLADLTPLSGSSALHTLDLSYLWGSAQPGRLGEAGCGGVRAQPGLAEPAGVQLPAWPTSPRCEAAASCAIWTSATARRCPAWSL